MDSWQARTGMMSSVPSTGMYIINGKTSWIGGHSLCSPRSIAFSGNEDVATANAQRRVVEAIDWKHPLQPLALVADLKRRPDKQYKGPGLRVAKLRAVNAEL